ncbi:MAG: heme ABC exporter ATP-binding protein CcmA [Hyphomicrobiaceae bacterium]|nr:heme ABC exporter ATP-binding protein CcmA [Hyphomicrobiaceae bacterium]
MAPDADTRPGLTVERLAVERGGRRVLSELSFEVAAGEALLLTGPNGAGKTTLLRTIAGFLAPASGRIALAGSSGEQPIAERAHYVGHTNAVRPTLTVEENASFWARYLGGSDGRVRPALDRFGLASLAAIPTGYLSAGQKRRLALARLLLAQRPLWLLDEPSASLDASSTRVLAGVLDGHVAAGGLVVAATHLDLGLARSRELRLGFAAGQA